MSKDYDLPDEVPGSNSYPPCPPRPVFSPPLSRRDRFAMAAMAGILASGAYPSRATLYDVRDAALESANIMIKALDGGAG